MDPRSGKFLANAVLETGEVQRIAGYALVTMPVPVPITRLLPDDIIMEDDLTVMRLPVGRIGAYVMTDMEEVVGKQVRRVLTPGGPFRRSPSFSRWSSTGASGWRSISRRAGPLPGRAR